MHCHRNSSGRSSAHFFKYARDLDSDDTGAKELRRLVSKLTFLIRTYKGKEYRAAAIDGYLVRMDNQVKYNSLNQLSRSIHDNVENAWNNWYVPLKDDQRQLITGLSANDPSRTRPEPYRRRTF